ncbi:3736_t:CDS:2, partial [Rhizophagus irregularis]
IAHAASTDAASSSVIPIISASTAARLTDARWGADSNNVPVITITFQGPEAI